MKFIRAYFAPIIILSALITLQACKAKKLAQKPAPPAEAAKPAAPVEPPKPAPAETTPKIVSAPVKQPEININEVKIQFEFDSSVLRTDAYAILDQVASQMKLNPTITYYLNGYASIEGTKEHNLVLSKDRANAVKTYLVNAGVSAAIIKTKGYGTRNPVADNSTEAGRILNRRVEIKTKH